MVNTCLFNHFHDLHWKKGYSTPLDAIDYLATTLKQKGTTICHIC